MEDTIYTKIIKGEIPCHKLYEDEHVLVILDIYPITDGHTLIISKQQIDHLWDVDDDHYLAMFTASKRLGPILRDHFGVSRTSMMVEGYMMPHAHIHLIPANDHKTVIADQDFDAEPDHAALAKIAAELKEKINAK